MSITAPVQYIPLVHSVYKVAQCFTSKHQQRYHQGVSKTVPNILLVVVSYEDISHKLGDHCYSRATYAHHGGLKEEVPLGNCVGRSTEG